MPAIGIDYEIPIEFFKMNTGGACPVFAIGDCVLIERYTGKSYSYRAINLSTKEEKHLFHLKTPLTKTDHTKTADKITALNIFSLSEKKTALNTLQRFTGKIRALFTDVLTAFGYVKREKQIELAEHMITALHERYISLSEAAVGTGKTHAYIIAAVLIKRSGKNDFWIRSTYPLTNSFHSDTPMPVVISTTSIALQKAVTETYIPEISKILLSSGQIDKPLSCVVRKGKEHYICDERLKECISKADKKTADALRPLLNRGYLNIDLDGVSGIDEYTKRKICVTHCNSYCPACQNCRYQRFFKYAQSPAHDFQVCNHNYMIADLIHRKKEQRPLIPNYQAVIIDEAHNLPKVAEQMYGATLSSKTLPALAELLGVIEFKDKKLTPVIKSCCDRLVKLNDELFGILQKSVPARDEYEDDTERFSTVIGSKASRLIRSIRYYLDEITTRLNGVACAKQRQEARYSLLQWQLKQQIEAIAVFQKPNSIVYWLEYPKLTRKVTGEILLVSRPKELGRLLHRDLWSKPIPIILTSGTLSVGGSFEHIKTQTGLEYVKGGRLTETSKPSPFDFKKNCLLYISENVPFPDNNSPAYIRTLAGEIERLIKAGHGHAAVLFTSYRVMERVYSIIKGRNVGFPLFKLCRGSTDAIDRFRKSGNGVLFASGSMWEGIDLPGDILSLLIIPKLPFPVPDPVGHFEQGRYASPEEYRRLVVFPEMMLKLKQGVGRLIRTEKDTGAICILDSRVSLGGKYRDQVLKALPLCMITGEIADVEQFFIHRKEQSYFEKASEPHGIHKR